MNLRRGLMRGWGVVSVLWAAGWIGAGVILSSGGGSLDAQEIETIAVLALGGPIALLAIGHAVAWVLRGFRA